MNQIINMIIRQVMNQLVRRGVNAGFDQASKIGNRKQWAVPPDALDDFGNPVAPQMSREERQQQRQARQSAKRAQQSLKAVRRISKF